MNTIAIHNATHISLHFSGALPDSLLHSISAPIPFPTLHQPIPPAQGEVWPGQGGYYIGTMPAIQGAPGYHLVMALEFVENIAYGGYEHDTPGAASQHDGAANTNALLFDSQPHPAAQWAADMRADDHIDYYLPSRAELFLAWLCAPQLFKKTGYYWSSSQSGSHLAGAQDFGYGCGVWSIKGDEACAAAVRRIPLL